jgi:hypothetical protein
MVQFSGVQTCDPFLVSENLVLGCLQGQQLHVFTYLHILCWECLCWVQRVGCRGILGSQGQAWLVLSSLNVKSCSLQGCPLYMQVPTEFHSIRLMKSVIFKLSISTNTSQY